MKVLCIVTAQGVGVCSTIHSVKLAVHSTEGYCTATTMVLTSIKQKESVHKYWQPHVDQLEQSSYKVRSVHLSFA